MSSAGTSLFLTALGWGLLNSLWQFAICWLLYRIIIAAFPTLSAAAKHSAALFLLMAGTAGFAAGLYWKFHADATAISGFSIESNHYYYIWQSANSGLARILPYWSLLYLASVLFLLARFALLVRRAGTLQHNGITKMDAVWRVYVQSIADRLGIRQPVTAMLSVHIDTPQVIGFLKPVILLPAACLTNLTTEQLEAVLLHELVHVKRNDYLVNLFVTSTEIIFFFNPFVKLLTRSLRREREYSCDDMVMQFRYHPHHYASALLTLEKNRSIPVTYGIAASGKNGHQLLTRIERIMGIQHRPKNSYTLQACLLALLLLAFIVGITPAKVRIDKFGSGSLSLAENAIMALGDEPVTVINNRNPVPAETQPAVVSNSKPVHNPVAGGKNATAHHPENLTLSFADPAGDNDNDNDALQVADKQAIDFSLPEKTPAQVPVAEPAEDAVAMEPYVPASSFSFHVTQDSDLVRMRGETYNERLARENQARMQKAIEQLNWQKIEKQLRAGNQNLSKLKRAITAQLKTLDWEKINEEIQTETAHQQYNKVQDLVSKDQALKQYRVYEAYTEALSRQIAEQEQVLKESSQRVLETQRAANAQQKKMEADLKKKRIIYL